MIKEFEGKVAVVTGAGSGIGRSMALTFANKGMKVVLAEIDERRLKRVSRKLVKGGTEVLALKIDVSEPNQVQNLADHAYKQFGNVNILCNNAGLGGSGPLHLLELGDWDMTLGINLFGVIYGIKYFLGRMYESGEPCHIVNTASLAGHLTSGENGPYSASKFAVVSISENLAQQCFNTNVSVSVLCPGYINTNIVENTFGLREKRTDLFQNTQISNIDQINLANAIRILKSGLNPDIVARMVIYAIENDIFYIMTHPIWNKLIKARFERIDEDARKIKEAFPEPERDKKMKTFEYKTETLSFSISYPDNLKPLLPIPDTNQVFFASEEFRQYMGVFVSEIDSSIRLDDTTKILSNKIKEIGNKIKILSDNQRKLDDGTISKEIVIEYLRFGVMKIKSHHISVIKDNKWIRVSSSAPPYYFNEDLIKITHSLKFIPAIVEIAE